MGVATATAIAGVAAAAISTGKSIADANKAKKAGIKAKKQVEAATNEAKLELERMPMQELAINLDVYEQSREAQQKNVQQVMSQVGGDSRQAAAVGGRAMMASIEGERAIRSEQAKEQFELEKLKAEERQQASDALTELSLAEAEGAQAAVSDAATRERMSKQAAIAAGVEGIGQVADLYSAAQGAFDPEKLDMKSQAPPMPSGVSGVQAAVAANNLNSSQAPIQYTDPNTGQTILLDPRTGRPIR
jgi:hypothetical protein